MIDPLLYVFILITELILAIGLVYVSFWIPKKLGYRRIGNALAIIVALLILAIVINEYFGLYSL
jgi:hypothetical protein